MTMNKKKDAHDTQDDTPSPKQESEQKAEQKKQAAQEKKPEHAVLDKKTPDTPQGTKPEEEKAEPKGREEPHGPRKDEDTQQAPHHHRPHTAGHKPRTAHHAAHDTDRPEHKKHAGAIDNDEGKSAPNYWKIATAVLAILFVITFFKLNMGPEAPIIPAAPTGQGQDTTAPAQGAPELADTSKDPAVTLTVLNDPSCASCDTSQVLPVITGQVFPKTTVKEVNVNSEEGQALARKYEINAIPAYLYEKGVEGSANFDRVAEAMLDKGDAYLIHPAATGAGKYLNPPGEDDDPVLGEKDAPVTIIEFSDFECPFCKRFHDETLPRIKEQYIRTGKVKFVYRDFPLPIHPNAQKAAEAAECADDQGQFWAYHDMLFENQQALGVAKLKEYAQDLGLDMEEFNDCLDSGKFADEVNADLEDGADAGVSGTPAFFIEGELVSGAQPFEAFARVIDAALGE